MFGSVTCKQYNILLAWLQCIRFVALVAERSRILFPGLTKIFMFAFLFCCGVLPFRFKTHYNSLNSVIPFALQFHLMYNVLNILQCVCQIIRVSIYRHNICKHQLNIFIFILYIFNYVCLCIIYVPRWKCSVPNLEQPRAPRKWQYAHWLNFQLFANTATRPWS